MLTFCIPSKNNLRYLKPCIKSIQDNSYYQNEILVYVDQDKDGTVEWLETQDVNFIINPTDTPKGIGHAYDIMFKEAQFDYVMAFHADMILGPHADYEMMDIKDGDNIVCATRIEPPLHPPGQEKIVQDFGMWPEDLKIDEFNKFVEANKSKRITKSIFAPWLIHKDQHLGHDPIFRSVFEDADLFRRFKLYGYQLEQSWAAMVYHLTCRGGQFAHAEKMEDFQKRDESWQINNSLSMYEYIRKWGGFLKQSDTLEPIPNVKYDIGLEITNCNKYANFFGQLEPYFNNLKIDGWDPETYIKSASALSAFDIESKFVEELTNDVVVSLDYNDLVTDISSINQLVNILPDMITNDVEEPGEYELGIYKVTVNKKEEKRPKLKLC